MNAQNGFIIPITFLAGILLMMLPMPDFAVWSRPAWVLLILIYWNMTLPHRVNLMSAWFLGILLDVLNGTLLGEHALALVIVSYLVVRIHSRMHMFHVVQQGMSVFFLVMIYQFVIYGVQGFLGELRGGWLYWSPALTSMLLWPWILSIMHNCRRRFRLI